MSTRQAPRQLQLGSNSSTAPALGPRSAPLSSDAKSRNGPRRQSSISYKPTSPRSDPSTHNTELAQNSSTAPTIEPRSAPISSDAKSRNGPRRQSSISYKPTSPRSDLSTHSTELGPSSDSARDSGPATLAEKHADLLRFIAQKESRCLELRTQLVQHEGDLLLLKRKWERIVSKGGPQVQGDRDRGDMLEGIREGVQSGLGKVLAALEPTPTTASQARTAATSTSPDMISPTSAPADKRSSISVTSRRTRSSISTSSAGSLFDDSAALEEQSSASSMLDSPEMKPTDAASTVSPHFSRATRRNSSTIIPQKLEPKCATENDASAKRRPEQPAFMGVTQSLVSDRTPSTQTQSTGISLGKQVSEWMPGLNKTWVELKSNEIVSRQSKRASMLFNDMLSVLVSPASPMTSQHPPSPTVLDSAFFEPATAASIGVESLLDMEKDEPAESVGVVLEPQIKTSPLTSEATNAEDDDEEWNW